MQEPATIAEKTRKPREKRLPIEWATILLFIDLILSMPCLCTLGVAIAKIKAALLLVFACRIAYLHWKHQLTMRDVWCYESIFLVVCALGFLIHH